MKNPKVSIVIPVYKVEQYLGRCIKSVRAQTFTDWEMILVDDGSPDQCGAICENYAAQDRRIQVIHQKNGGLSAARNAGMKHCKGKYLLFVDSDDYLAEEALEFLVGRAEEGMYDIVMAGHYRVEPDGSMPTQSDHWMESNDLLQIRRAILCNTLPNFAWGKLYLRTLWNERSFPKDRLVEDLSAVAPVFYAASSACVYRKPLYFYSHENLGSIMNQPNIKNYIRIRLGRFFGWREHELLAAQFDPGYLDFCALEALRAGIRALMLDTERDVIGLDDRREIMRYIVEHAHVQLPFTLRMLTCLTRRDWKGVLRILGNVQKWLVLRQTAHRFDKLRKKMAQQTPGGRV